MGQVALSFVVPAYNESKHIMSALVSLDDMAKPKKVQYEVVVVDDGSKDDTLSKARQYANMNGHVRIISYTKNQGKGYAVQAGFMQTTGDVVVFVDSDRDIDVSIISSYVEALKDGDIAIASKWHPDSVVEMPIVRKVLSHSFNVLVRLLVGVSFKDSQAGLKAMRRDAFENVFPRLAVKRYAFDVELLAVAKSYGLKVVEMPTRLNIESSF